MDLCFKPRTSHHFSHYICNLANSEDPEEMSHDASFHEGPHCLLLLSSTKTVFSEKKELVCSDQLGCEFTRMLI